MGNITANTTITRTSEIATIEFGSPAHNALSSDLIDQLITHIQSVQSDTTLKVILLKSQGDRTFCAGADLTELLNIDNELSGKTFFNQFARLILAIRHSPHLILCRVQGKAIGGAVGIIAAADYVIATEAAQLRLSELINGIGPFVVGPAIERKMGSGAFNHMTLSPALWHGPAYGVQHSLFNEIKSDIPSLDLAVDHKLKEWASYSKPAMKEIKRMMWSSTPDWDLLLADRAATSGRLVMSAEARVALGRLKKL